MAPNWQLEAEGGGRDLRLRRRKPNRALRQPGLLAPHPVLKSKDFRLSSVAFLARLGFAGRGTGVRRSTMSARRGGRSREKQVQLTDIEGLNHLGMSKEKRTPGWLMESLLTVV